MPSTPTSAGQGSGGGVSFTRSAVVQCGTTITLRRRAPLRVRAPPPPASTSPVSLAEPLSSAPDRMRGVGRKQQMSSSS